MAFGQTTPIRTLRSWDDAPGYGEDRPSAKTFHPCDQDSQLQKSVSEGRVNPSLMLRVTIDVLRGASLLLDRRELSEHALPTAIYPSVDTR